MISNQRPRTDWTDEFGKRAFWFDAFLSYNRKDESDALLSRLRAEGAHIASDHKGAPEGWPFPTSLFVQLRASRFIIVSVGQAFRQRDGRNPTGPILVTMVWTLAHPWSGYRTA